VVSALSLSQHLLISDRSHSENDDNNGNSKHVALCSFSFSARHKKASLGDMPESNCNVPEEVWSAIQIKPPIPLKTVKFEAETTLPIVLGVLKRLSFNQEGLTLVSLETPDGLLHS
jgi:hypothetical protein